MKELSQKVSSFKDSIFATISREAVENQAVNLGQGFPDFPGPQWIIDILKSTYHYEENVSQQYAPFAGVLALRESVSRQYLNKYSIGYSPEDEITIVNGATEGIFCTCLALLNPLDEVIVLEPFYDSYKSSIELAGAKAIASTINLPDLSIDFDHLEKCVSSKTKMLILNNPHNPTGKVFTLEELSKISILAQKHDLYVLSDEVYEFLTFDERAHLPLAGIKEMKERVITISSVGKTFGMTGMKIGWVCANEKISHAIRLVHQFNTFSVHHPSQVAFAKVIDQSDYYLQQFKETYQQKRDFFFSGLQKAGFSPLKSEGTYFMMCSIPNGLDDVTFCRELIKSKKVASIPPSSFYLNSDQGKKYIRFCFAKKDETLSLALKNLS
ncbi:MAG: aminotransferase [Bdellovibrio sp. CG_4_9_14_3_um_filter_39_7]|nr:MAG: aminotransferase [Bdellovibrio sp. CG_4_9_14_3_um_filter_39_7]